MIQGLLRRIERLEALEKARKGVFVVQVQEGETDEEAETRAGVPANAELIVLLHLSPTERPTDKARSALDVG